MASLDPLHGKRFSDIVYYDRGFVSFESSLEVGGFWEDSSPEFEDLNETAVIFGDFSVGIGGDQSARLQIDTMSRSSLTACASPVSPSSSIEVVSLDGLTTGLTSSQVCMGSTLNLIDPVPVVLNRDEREHQATSAMRVRWGGSESGGSISWTVDRDLTDYSFLSFRAGHIDHLSPESMTTLSVGIVTVDGQSDASFSVDVNIYTQDDPSDIQMSVVYVTNFMRTYRIPMSVLCDLGADVSDVLEIVIAFPEEEESRSILIDSLEFTKSAGSMEPGRCLE